MSIRLHCDHCPARFSAEWERIHHERTDHAAPSVPAGDVAKLVEELRGTRTPGAEFLCIRAATALESLSRDLAEARAAERKAIDELCRWRAAFQSVTPGGSEFMDPNAVKAWADTLKMQVFEANKKAVLAERRARSVLSTQPKETPDVA